MRDETIHVGGVDVAVRRGGDGPTVVYLHGEDGLLFSEPLLDRLSARFHVVAPGHPGWATPRPGDVRCLDDIAYLYLDLLAQLGGQCTLVGASMGGWLAAEVATKSLADIAGVVLVAPLGIKTTGRDERGFVDLWATAPATLQAALYGDVRRAPDLTTLDDEGFTALATAQEAVARYGWEPYLHNPHLRHRLRRITVPTTVLAGAADGFVLDPHYWERYCAAIGPHATLVPVPGAGHRIEEEAPAAVVAAVEDHVRTRADRVTTSAGRP